MRLSIRAKQIAGVTAIVGLAVVALSGSTRRALADVIVARELLARRRCWPARSSTAREASSSTAPTLRRAARRSRPAVDLESSLYGERRHHGADRRHQRHHRDATAIRWSVDACRSAPTGSARTADALNKLAVIYSGDGRRSKCAADDVGDEAFGSIRVGVSTLLMRRLNSMTAVLGRAVHGGRRRWPSPCSSPACSRSSAAADPRHPQRLDAPRRGEFGVTLDLPPGDEFGELGTFFNTVSQQLSADRSLLADQKANLQSAVEHLEDAVALFNPSGELLFSNPAMQRRCLRRDRPALSGLLPTGHPYRTLVEETLATRARAGRCRAGHQTEPSGAQAADSSRGHRAGDEELVMTHAIAGTERRAGRRAARLAQPGAAVARAVDDRIRASWSRSAG